MLIPSEFEAESGDALEASQLGPRLVALDPDLEDLFAAVEDVLCHARMRYTQVHAARPRHRRSGTPLRSRQIHYTAGRRPAQWLPSQRGPPRRPGTSIHIS